MASLAVQEEGPIRIVTGDRDLFQMVDDARDVKVVYLAKGLSQHDLVNKKWIADRYQIPGDRYDLFAMFRGDPSDGLPGVRGIGEKGAALIANNFDSPESALQGAIDEHPSLSPNLRKKIVEGADYLAIAPTLVRCVRDLPLPQVSLKLPLRPADIDVIYDLKERYGLGASIDRLIAALQW